MSLTTAIASLNAALTTLKALRGIDKAFDQATLKGQVIDLMGNVNDAKAELLEAQEALSAKDAEIARLEKAMTVRSELIEGPGGYYWANKGDGLRRGYPICPTCDVKDARQVNMVQARNHHTATCPRCSNTFSPVEFYFEPKDGKERTASEVTQQALELQNRENNAALRRLGSGNDWMA